MTPLGSVLFTDYRRRVLGLLLLHPERRYYLREMARLTGTVPGTLKRELSKLESAGVLTVEKVGNQAHYAANRDCPIFEELASVLRKTSGLADVLSEGLAPLAAWYRSGVGIDNLTDGPGSGILTAWKPALLTTRVTAFRRRSSATPCGCTSDSPAVSAISRSCWLPAG